MKVNIRIISGDTSLVTSVMAAGREPGKHEFLSCSIIKKDIKFYINKLPYRVGEVRAQ